jgi:hypothetical protein
MNRPIVPQTQRIACRFHRSTGVTLLVALICCGLTAAQNLTQKDLIQQEANKPFSIRATHLLGFENAKSKCSGTLSSGDNSLQFSGAGNRANILKISSVRNIFAGEESRQVGGLPMTLGKAAAPYGGGPSLVFSRTRSMTP